MSEQDRSTLAEKEPHPSAESARQWLNEQVGKDPTVLPRWREAFSSCAIEDIRLAEVCAGTVDRILNEEPISDRYLLGLVWAMRYEELYDEAVELLTEINRLGVYMKIMIENGIEEVPPAHKEELLRVVTRTSAFLARIDKGGGE